MHLVLPPTAVLPTRTDTSASSHSIQPPNGQTGATPPHAQLPLQDYLQTPGLRFRGTTPATIRAPATPSGQPATQVHVTLSRQINSIRQQAADLEQLAAAREGSDVQHTRPGATHGSAHAPSHVLYQSPSSVPQPSMQPISSQNLPTGPNGPTRSTRPTPENRTRGTSTTRGSRESNPLRRSRDGPERSERPSRRSPDVSTTLVDTNIGGQGFATTSASYNPVFPLGTPSLSNTHGLSLLSMQQLIISMETQLNWGVIPPVEQMSRIRTSLYQILDAQYQNPLGRRDGFAEGLLSRLSNLYIRADQLRIYRSRFPHAPAPNNLPSNLTAPNTSQSTVYLLSSPSGYQGLVMAPTDAAAGMMPTASAPPLIARTVDNAPRPTQPQDPAQGAPRAAAINNAINQALIQQRAAPNIGPTAFARTARRVWLFIRLYFFCYLFSDSGTWSRVILVCLAVLISLLSETDTPQQFHRALFGPIQRHLEGLVHLGGDGGVNRPGQQPVHPHGDQIQNQAGRPTGGVLAPGGANSAGVQQWLRRLERSIALFIASLVPGVGERHIEVRNAAEAALQNQERARVQEEEGRAQENGGQQDPPVPPDVNQPPPEHIENRQENGA